VRAGLSIPNFGPFADPARLTQLAGAAETAGWDGFWLWDHVVRHEADVDVADPWVALAVVAAATTRLRIGPLVTPLARRRPWNVARSAVTLDHLSGGRVTLGIGLGSGRGPEFAAFGEVVDPVARGDLLDEGLAIVRAAWTGEPVTHRGRYFNLDSMRFLPRPVQSGGIPVWAAVERTSGRAVRRAASCDGVVPNLIGPERLPELLAGIEAARGGLAGYDVVVMDEDAGRWVGSGATWWLRTLPWEAPFASALKVVAAGPPAG
jgi:alkanesulfonate monooxygenase SsuD/methylene tetrahydromethanopterin reductase-like flavin-dependent oxidoreductase (luciferase family)